MAAASGFTVVGSGVVGSELALDLKAFFPDKPVNVVTRSEVGFLPRVPGAHEFVAKVCDEKGVGLVTGKVIKKTDEDGRLVTADGEHIGDKGARTCELTGCSNMTRAFHRTCPPPSAFSPTPSTQLGVHSSLSGPARRSHASGDIRPRRRRETRVRAEPAAAAVRRHLDWLKRRVGVRGGCESHHPSTPPARHRPAELPALIAALPTPLTTARGVTGVPADELHRAHL